MKEEDKVVEEEKICLALIRWREAVDACPTWSRLHVLMAILEACIKWEKSAENAVSEHKTRWSLCYFTPPHDVDVLYGYRNVHRINSQLRRFCHFWYGWEDCTEKYSTWLGTVVGHGITLLHAASCTCIQIGGQ